MHIGPTRWALWPGLLLFVASLACTGSPVSSRTQTTPVTSSPAPFARYFFLASGDRGVLEVSSSPPSICYWTQSFPARPISIVPGPAATMLTHAAVTYVPHLGEFCDRSVSRSLTVAMIAHPSAYQVRWSPRPGSATTFSLLSNA